MKSKPTILTENHQLNQNQILLQPSQTIKTSLYMNRNSRSNLMEGANYNNSSVVGNNNHPYDCIEYDINNVISESANIAGDNIVFSISYDEKKNGVDMIRNNNNNNINNDVKGINNGLRKVQANNNGVAKKKKPKNQYRKQMPKVSSSETSNHSLKNIQTTIKEKVPNSNRYSNNKKRRNGIYSGLIPDIEW